MDGKTVKEILARFEKEMKRKCIPYYVIGIVRDKKDNPVLEIVVKRPERYNDNKVLSKIPKYFCGIEVHIA